MIRANRFLAAVCLTISFHSYASTGIFIGNGGEGVEVGDRLFLKDLYLAHAHEKPYFGDHIDPELPSLPDNATMNFSYPRELLARKLTDLNRVLPGLGDYVLASMKAYHWKLQDLPLNRIEEFDQVVSYPVELRQIQIANRFQSLIRIDRNAYARLDDANRVALLLHEAVYSLVKPSPAGEGRFYQSVHIVRDLVGLFFQSDFFEMSDFQVLIKVNHSLNVPDPTIPLKELRKSTNWRISAIDPIASDNEYAMKTVEKVWQYPVSGKSIKQIDDSIRFICDQVRARAKERLLYDFTIELEARPVTLRMDSYTPPGNFAVPQLSVRIEPVLQTSRQFTRFATSLEIDDCEARVGAKKARLIQDFSWMQ